MPEVYDSLVSLNIFFHNQKQKRMKQLSKMLVALALLVCVNLVVAPEVKSQTVEEETRRMYDGHVTTISSVWGGYYAALHDPNNPASLASVNADCMNNYGLTYDQINTFILLGIWMGYGDWYFQTSIYAFVVGIY